MKRLALFLAFFVCIGLRFAMAQNVQITGTVTSSEDGQPLPGASVMVKGTNIGTTTNFDGKYSLSVPADAQTLVVNFVGLKTQEVAIGGRTVIDVVLQPDVQSLDEVVVTALGIKRSQKALGYSATTVTNEDLTASSNRSALNALQGKVAGVNISSASGAPGASTRVFMRGFSSLSGSNQPLYVVDGIPVSNAAVGSTSLNGGTDFGNSVNDINPDDIESVTILKGGSGTALYGSRAATGVIIITTKKGSDRKGKGALVEVNSSMTFDNPLRLPLFQNEFGQGWYDGSLAANLEENGSWGPKFDGKIHQWGHIVDNSQQIKPYVALKDNYKDFFNTGKTYNNSLIVTDGNENSSYYLSYNNVNADGIMPTNADSYKRNIFTVKGSTKFLKSFTASAEVAYTNKQGKFVPTGQDQSVLDGMLQTPRDISIVDMKDYNNKFNNLDNYFTVYAQNPYFVLNEHGNKYTDNKVYGNVKLDYQILPWLAATYRIGTDVSDFQLKEWRAIVKSVRGNYNDEAGRVTESSFFTQELTSDFFFTINKDLSPKFKLNATLGQTMNQTDTRSLSAGVIGLDIPGYYKLSNSSATPTTAESISKKRLVGVLGTVELSYADMVYLTVTGRNDWSSSLPENNRSFFYPSLNGSFVFSELMPGIKDVLSFGKIRAGYSQTGKDAPAYSINSVFVQSTLTDGYRNLQFPLPGGINGFGISNQIGNPKLQPEISSEFEVGTDLRFFDGRISADLTYYNKVTTDLIWPATIARSTGYSTQIMNLGKLTNEGIEVLLTVEPVRVRDFDWKLTWTYTNNKNRLAELNPDLTSIPIGGTSSVGLVGLPGQPLCLIEGAVPLMHDGKVVVDNKGLPIIDPEKQIYGKTQYDYMMGFVNEFTYKGLSLSANLDIRQGGIMYSRTAEMMYFTGNAPQTTYNDREPFIIPNSVYESEPGVFVENTTPIYGSNNNMNLYFNQTYGGGQLGKAFTIPKSFVKLREVVLSYRLPKKVLAGSKIISNVQLSIYGRNLLIWTPKDNTFIDPELTTFGNDLQAEYGEYGASPTLRSIGASVKLTF